LRVVGQAIRVVPGGGAPEFGAGVFVQGHHLIAAGGCGVHPVTLWYDQHAVDLGQVVDGAHYSVGVHVDFDHLAGAQMCDKQQPAAGIEAGVVKA
jgi:hypothetical protein